jgi:PHD/YefM family antitoxin component YafN of YafNO toxin-antitoxin module
VTKHRLISAARAELFELFEEVIAHDGKKVVIEHRTSPKKAVLISADYLERLERLERDAPKAGAFTLYGSGTLHVDPEDVLKDVRREENATAEKRLHSFAVPAKKRAR